MSPTWDVLVVGGGTAGIVSATTAAGFGANVLLVERHRLGGDCLWSGCVPSKAIIAAARAAAGARRAHRLGISVVGVEVDFAGVMEHVRAAIRTIEPDDSAPVLEAAGVTVRSGALTFVGPRVAELDGRPISFAQAIVCTGSEPAMPPIPGLADAEPLTSESIWDIDTLPARLAVLGGGGIGCELGQAFARLGSQVTIVEAADRILPGEDPEAAGTVAAALSGDGVRLRTGATVAEVRSTSTGTVLVLDDGDHVECDRLLVSVGRQPRQEDLGWGRAGVRLDEGGYIRVDQHLRSTNPDIWAAGDVTGPPQFTHVAGVNGSVAASNAVLGLRRRADTGSVPRVTFTDPEVAAVGVGIDEAVGDPVLRILTQDHHHLDRAVAESDVRGFTKLVVDGRRRIVGATVVGPRAGETLGEVCLAVRHSMPTRDVAATTHAYPTYNDGVWKATIDDVRAQLGSAVVGRGARLLASGRQWWVRSSLRERLSSGDDAG